MADEPWLKYQQAAPGAGPWTKYATAEPDRPDTRGKAQFPDDSNLSIFDRLWRGIGGGDATVPGKVAMGMADPAVGIGQLAGKAGAAQLGAEAAIGGLGTQEKPQSKYFGMPEPLAKGGEAIDKKVQEREQRYEGSRIKAGEKPTGGVFDDMWRTLGNVASPVNLVPGAAIGKAVPGVSLGGRLLGAALGGATGGASQPVTKGDFWTEKAKQTGIGAAAGLALGGAGEAIASRIAPSVTPDAAALMDKGVRLTPGRMQPGVAGIRQTMEDKLQSWPILGDFLRNAHRSSLQTFNESTINQALEPIGASLPSKSKFGTEAISTAWNAISTAYDNVLSRIPKVVVDRDMVNAMKAIELDARGRPKVWNVLRGELQDVNSKIKRGTFDGKEAQLTMSELGRKARGMQNSDDFFTREVSRYLQEARSSILDAIERQYPKEAPDLRNANAAWAMMTRVGNASIRRSGSQGVFTPFDLLQASRAGAGGPRRMEFQKGDALFQEWANIAQRVLPSTIPDSGTAGRLLGSHPLSALVQGGLNTGAYGLLTGRLPKTYGAPSAASKAVGQGVRTGAQVTAPGVGATAAEKKRRRDEVLPPASVR